MTLTFLANQALRHLGVLPTGASLGAGSSQLTEALDIIGNLTDNWSADPYMAISAPISSFTLSGGVQYYAIGTGQAFNMARPAEITAAAITLANGITEKVKVCTAQEWAAIEDRAAQAHLVEYLFYDRGFSVGRIGVSPIPIGTPTLEITTWLSMPRFTDATTDVALYPAYARMLEWATAMELSAQYPGAKNLEMVAANLADAKATVRNLNASLLGQAPPEGQTGAASK